MQEDMFVPEGLVESTPPELVETGRNGLPAEPYIDRINLVGTGLQAVQEEPGLWTFWYRNRALAQPVRGTSEEAYLLLKTYDDDFKSGNRLPPEDGNAVKGIISAVVMSAPAWLALAYVIWRWS